MPKTVGYKEDTKATGKVKKKKLSDREREIQAQIQQRRSQLAGQAQQAPAGQLGGFGGRMRQQMAGQAQGDLRRQLAGKKRKKKGY